MELKEIKKRQNDLLNMIDMLVEKKENINNCKTNNKKDDFLLNNIYNR